MFNVPLQSIPNQSFTILLDEKEFGITLKEANGVMVIDISINSIPIVSGVRCVSDYPVINYKYLESGNFLFITANDELPYYTEFNSTQSLVYITQAELVALRA